MAKDQKSTLSEKAYQMLMDKIYTLDSGSFISARKLASELGMSYTPVREALLCLQQEGYIKLIPNVGFFVETMNFSDIIQYYQVRKCLEPFVLEQIFDLITEEHIKKLKEYIEMQRMALKNSSVIEYVKSDIQFHMIKFKIYGNEYLKEIYTRVRDQHMICSRHILQDEYLDVLKQHERLVNFIEQGRKEDAVRLLGDHINAAEQRQKKGFVNVVE